MTQVAACRYTRTAMMSQHASVAAPPEDLSSLTRRLERNLAALYITSICLAATTLTCTLVAWLHWNEILDNCDESGVYCGCVLYGSETFNYFVGGDLVLCHFVVYASVPVIVVAVVLAAYHGYRACVEGKRVEKRVEKRVRVNRRTGEVIPMARPSGYAWAGADPHCVCWAPLAILALLLAGLLFSQAVVLSDGYRKTCHEYRKHVVKMTMATGQTASCVYDRIACDSIFDFMDYLEPFSRPYRPDKDRDSKYPYQAERDRMRGGMINTGAALQVAMATTWLNCIAFVAIVVHNVLLARRTPGFVRCWCC